MLCERLSSGRSSWTGLGRLIWDWVLITGCAAWRDPPNGGGAFQAAEAIFLTGALPLGRCVAMGVGSWPNRSACRQLPDDASFDALLGGRHRNCQRSGPSKSAALEAIVGPPREPAPSAPACRLVQQPWWSPAPGQSVCPGDPRGAVAAGPPAQSHGHRLGRCAAADGDVLLQEPPKTRWHSRGPASGANRPLALHHCWLCLLVNGHRPTEGRIRLASQRAMA